MPPSADCKDEKLERAEGHGAFITNYCDRRKREGGWINSRGGG